MVGELHAAEAHEFVQSALVRYVALPKHATRSNPNASVHFLLPTTTPYFQQTSLHSAPVGNQMEFASTH
jgi:hypothetical protein